MVKYVETSYSYYSTVKIFTYFSFILFIYCILLLLNILAGTREGFLVEMFGIGGTLLNPNCQYDEDSTMSICIPTYGCKCQNSYNNTWFCERKLNMDENSLTCQFDDEEKFIETYDLNDDPYQLNNLYVECTDN